MADGARRDRRPDPRRRSRRSAATSSASLDGSQLLLALAYFGFFLNLFNLIPFGFFDGGAIWRSARWLRLGGGGAKAYVVYALYVATAVVLIASGMIASHVPQHRL